MFSKRSLGTIHDLIWSPGRCYGTFTPSNVIKTCCECSNFKNLLHKKTSPLFLLKIPTFNSNRLILSFLTFFEAVLEILFS